MESLLPGINLYNCVGFGLFPKSSSIYVCVTDCKISADPFLRIVFLVCLLIASVYSLEIFTSVRLQYLSSLLFFVWWHFGKFISMSLTTIMPAISMPLISVLILYSFAWLDCQLYLSDSLRVSGIVCNGGSTVWIARLVFFKGGIFLSSAEILFCKITFLSNRYQHHQYLISIKK